MQAATKEKSFTYQRRWRELTPCYRILQEEFATVLADRQEEGRPVPDYVAQEFEAYLKCGILSVGTAGVYLVQPGQFLHSGLRNPGV